MFTADSRLRATQCTCAVTSRHPLKPEGDGMQRMGLAPCRGRAWKACCASPRSSKHRQWRGRHWRVCRCSFSVQQRREPLLLR